MSRNVKHKKQGYTIIRTNDSKVKSKKFIVFKDGSFNKNHTHVSTLELGKTMIDIVVKEKNPTSRDREFIKSLIRLSSNERYINLLKRKLTNN